MKKKISVLLAVCMLFSVLIACNKDTEPEESLPDAQLAAQLVASEPTGSEDSADKLGAEPVAATAETEDATEPADKPDASEDTTTPSTDAESQKTGAAETTNSKATTNNNGTSNKSTGTNGSSGTTGTKPSTSTTKPTSPTSTPSKPSEPTPTKPKPTTPAEPAPTTPKPTEPAPKPTEPAPTEPAPTEPAPTEPTKANVDTAALEAYGRQYAASLGFTPSTELNLNNSGYFPGYSAALYSTDEGYTHVADSVQDTYNELMAADGTIEGARCNVIVEYDPVSSAGMGGSWYVIWVLYG